VRPSSSWGRLRGPALSIAAVALLAGAMAGLFAIPAVRMRLGAAGTSQAPPPPAVSTSRPAIAAAPPPPIEHPSLSAEPVLHVCGRSGSTFAIAVEQTSWAKRAGDSTASGVWGIILLDATNTGDRSDDLYLAVRLRDEQGRIFTMDGGLPGFGFDFAAAAHQDGALQPTDEIPPGKTARVIVAFDVAAGTGTVQLIGNPSFCGA
jgi:hypothetical protein